MLSMEIPGQQVNTPTTTLQEEGELEEEDSEAESQSHSSQFSVDKYQE